MGPSYLLDRLSLFHHLFEYHVGMVILKLTEDISNVVFQVDEAPSLYKSEVREILTFLHCQDVG